jgi:hypothetical protein
MLMLRIVPACAISPQQVGRAVDCIVSRHAEAGIAVQKTTAANIRSATFLPQFMVVVILFQL